MGANGSQNISPCLIYYLSIYLYRQTDRQIFLLQFKPIRPSHELQQNYHNVQCEETYIKQNSRIFLLRDQLNGLDVIKSSLLDFPC